MSAGGNRKQHLVKRLVAMGMIATAARQVRTGRVHLGPANRRILARLPHGPGFLALLDLYDTDVAS